MVSLKCDNDLPPRVLAADVRKRGSGFLEWIAAVDHGAHLPFVRQVCEIFEVGGVHACDEPDQMLVDERVDDLSLEHPQERADPRFLLGTADAYQGAARCE